MLFGGSNVVWGMEVHMDCSLFSEYTAALLYVEEHPLIKNEGMVPCKKMVSILKWKSPASACV